VPEIPDPVDPADCTKEHPEPAGPNMDLGQCMTCWMPVGVMRPEGETYGWHSDDCSLPLRHAGYCKPGGRGHVVPAGEKIRGHFGPNWSPANLIHETTGEEQRDA
jgi:hypothetical protein